MADIQLQAVEPPPAQQVDPLLYRLVVGALAAALLLTVVGGFVLAGLGIEVPGALIAIGAGCMGALGALLAPSPAQR
jgi:hypothetical protein